MSQKVVVPGKIILSGEYAVVFGYPGIAIPSSLKMTAAYEEGSSELTIDWHGEDQEWTAYAKRIVSLLEEQTGKKFDGKISIHNEIPLGRGMGSSTALVIMMVKAFVKTEGAPLAGRLRAESRGSPLRSIAFTIENIVNPGSSGIDFDTIWNGKPLLFQKGEKPVEAFMDLAFMEKAVLIDAGKPDQSTTELVAWMKTKEKDIEPILERIGQCAERFLEGEDPLAVIRDHHRAQVELGVVPEETAKLIQEIERIGGAAKVIGAGARTGGGGVVLALHEDPLAVRRIAESSRMKLLS